MRFLLFGVSSLSGPWCKYVDPPSVATIGFDPFSFDKMLI